MAGMVRERLWQARWIETTESMNNETNGELVFKVFRTHFNDKHPMYYSSSQQVALHWSQITCNSELVTV